MEGMGLFSSGSREPQGSPVRFALMHNKHGNLSLKLNLNF